MNDPRKNSVRNAWGLLAATLILAGGAASQQAPAEQVAQTVDRFVQACGGMERIDKLASVSCTATAEAYGLQYTMHLLADGRFRIEQPSGTVVYDGRDYWQSFHGLVHAVPPGPDLDRYHRISLAEAFFQNLVGTAAPADLSYRGTEMVRGRSCDILEGTTGAGARRTFYIDSATGLLQKYVEIAADPEVRERKSIFTVADHQNIDGLVLPARFHGVCITTNEEVQPLTQFSDLRVNESLDPSLFVRPAPTAPPVRFEGETLLGQVLALSGGGSLITNVTADDLARFCVRDGARLTAEVKNHATEHAFRTDIESFAQMGSGDYVATFNHTPALWLVKAYVGMRSDDSTYAPGDAVRLTLAAQATEEESTE
ncbi:MAG: hypothetical protein V1774_00735 [Candidatus Eisenbacteria bacterium]